MASGVPSHHIKQNVCATRPPYREGRQPKAVKVYTVNNESCYILIQGVPSVGAMEELHKLCSSFGSVEQFNALDEYPSEDKYTEVHLVQYKKIQSARFAKRKLDDHSFFGGTLHVSYAPEYESVAETREKLQDRRRVMAAKIRQYAQNTEKQNSLPSGNLQNTTHPAENSVVSRTNTLFLQEQKFSVQSEPYHHLETMAAVPVPGILDSTCAGVLATRLSVISSATDSVQPTFQLLPPPKSESESHNPKRNYKNTYEFSRVRSSHATLPPGYDARVMINVVNKSVHPEIRQLSASHTSRDSSQSTETTVLPSSESAGHSSIMPSSSIIVRDYKPSKPAPRFVPRQALKNKSEQSEAGTRSKISTDQLDQEIRKNAFCLGETQGPALIPQRKRTFSTAAQQSVNETISDIRNKISKVITQNVKKQTDLPGKTS